MNAAQLIIHAYCSCDFLLCLNGMLLLSCPCSESWQMYADVCHAAFEISGLKVANLPEASAGRNMEGIES